MSQVGVRELKDRLSSYLNRVQGGEEIIMTERGRSAARIVPVKTSSLKRVLEPMLQEGAVRWSGVSLVKRAGRPMFRGRTLTETVKK
ncbi:MAG: hypothetical protein OJF51_005137 [Nitrospira sp.]|jgi:prevent-host-death family protein|nr:MAG: hypothetical protein OJF51_005137 [Nitrospira sp.]